MAKKKKGKRKEPPVPTGHDARPVEGGQTRGASAPDGISGDWG